jgi:hypothetical protein
MKPWVRLLLWTIAFWAVWLGLAGLAMVVHGDCGLGATDAQIAACVREKGWVGIAAMAIGATIYAILIWRLTRRNRESGS